MSRRSLSHILPVLALFFSFAAPLHAADPKADRLIFTGASAAGTNSISFANNIYTFSFAGDEVLTYQLDLSDPFNAGGTLRIRELTSDSWPMDGAGFVFRDPGGLYWFPKDNYKKATLSAQSVSGLTVTLDYVLNFYGLHPVRYEITLAGKSLRIRMLDPTGNLSFASNFSGIYFGSSTGVESPSLVRMQGALAWPIVFFRKPTANGNLHFFTANALDMFQCSTADYAIAPLNNPVIGASSITCSLNTATQYKALSNGQLSAPLDDTYVMVVSSKIRDVLLTSTAPPSPYRGLLVNRMIFNGPEQVWSYYLGMFDLYLSLGMYNLAGYFFEWSAAAKDAPATINVGPDWFPAQNEAVFAELLAKGTAQGALVGAYSAFNCLPPNAPPAVYNPAEIVRDAAGAPKLYTQLGFPLLAVEASAPHAAAEIGKLKQAGANAVYLDIQTYGNLSKAPDGDHLDQQAGSPWAKTLAQGFAAQKTWFGATRETLEGPLLGEGSIATVNSNMEFLWNGYVDSVQRCINSASGVTAAQLPEGSPSAPTNWPIIPEYEWRVAAVAQVNHGNGFYDRFFSKSDGASVVDVSTGLPIFPLTQEAQDLYQAFLITYGHSGFVTTNGTQTENEGYLTHPAAAQTYFMSNALQSLYFSSPVLTIRYFYNGTFQTFEPVLFATETTETFRKIPIGLEFKNGLRLYINHGQAPLNITEGGVTYTLPARTGYLASAPGLLLSFSAIPPGTGGNRIDYCMATGQYEYFNGRGQVTSYGGISTEAKRSKWRVFPTSLTVTEDTAGNLATAYGAPVALSAVQIFPAVSVLAKGDRIGLRSVAFFANGSGQDVTTLLDWYSTKKLVAKVNAAGVLEALSSGQTMIYALTPGGGLISAPLTVTVP